MKQNIFKIAILSFVLFLASFESKAAAEFTWINHTGCALTVSFYDASSTLLYSSSSCCGAATCISGISYIEITDACGGVWRYTACGVLMSGYPTGTPCACVWTPNWGGTCGPAGGMCGPGSTLITIDIT